MGDGPRTVEIIPNYFETSASTDSPLPRSSDTSISGEESPHTSTSGTTSHLERNSPSSNISTNSATRKNFRTASFMLRLFSLKGLRSITGLNGEEKIELSAVELESLRSELADVEEREAHLKAQLEHLDELLRWSRLSGYLNMRTRWAALPGELPPIDDCDVDDWVPRFTVLQGPCLFFYLSSTVCAFSPKEVFPQFFQPFGPHCSSASCKPSTNRSRDTRLSIGLVLIGVGVCTVV